MADLYVGLMSGTSMDGVDAALCEFAGTRFLRVRATHTQAYPPALRSELLGLARDQPAQALANLLRLDHAVGEAFAAAAQGVLKRARVSASRVRAAGSHGQTVFHDPSGVKSSLQLGDPSLIAARAKLTVVADFRRADIARGGQGAPLVPAFHQAVFGNAREKRCIVNIGGIANVTILAGGKVRGFDTGPGNALMDEWCETQRGEALDAGGAWAASGKVVPGLLEALLADPYFSARPPKSTGRGYFNLEWVQRRAAAWRQASPADVQATFCELTARSIVDSVRTQAKGTRKILVCGGGALNDFLLERLRLLSGTIVETTASAGLAPQSVEAAAFAWLAMRALKGLPGNLPAVTGARAPAILGGIYKA